MTNEPEIVDEHILEVLADVRSGKWAEAEQLRWIKDLLRDVWEEGGNALGDAVNWDLSVAGNNPYA